MNIAFILGNGFDIQVGMSTRYSDFYNCYTKWPSSNSIVSALKANISADYETWGDLELGLGEYSINIDSYDDGLIIYNDILSALEKYLKQEENNYEYDIAYKNEILNTVFHPDKYLRPLEQKSVFSHFNRNEEWKVRFISFNYTKTLEKLLGDNKLPIDIKFQNEGKRSVTQIVHIHGYVGQRMVLGVNDRLQIKNTEWHSNRRLLRRYVKPIHNDTYKQEHDGFTKELINNSHVICLFGLSIGDSDKLWWKEIADRINASSSIRMIIFYFLPDFEPVGNYGPDYEDNVDMVKDKFLNAAGYSEGHKIRSQIFVSFQRNVFNFKLNRKK